MNNETCTVNREGKLLHTVRSEDCHRVKLKLFIHSLLRVSGEVAEKGMQLDTGLCPVIFFVSFSRLIGACIKRLECDYFLRRFDVK